MRAAAGRFCVCSCGAGRGCRGGQRGGARTVPGHPAAVAHDMGCQWMVFEAGACSSVAHGAIICSMERRVSCRRFVHHRAAAGAQRHSQSGGGRACHGVPLDEFEARVCSGAMHGVVVRAMARQLSCGRFVHHPAAVGGAPLTSMVGGAVPGMA